MKVTLMSLSEVQKLADGWGARRGGWAPPLGTGRRISRVGHTHKCHGNVAPGATAQTRVGDGSNSRTPQHSFRSEQHTKKPSHWPAHTQVTNQLLEISDTESLMSLWFPKFEPRFSFCRSVEAQSNESAKVIELERTVNEPSWGWLDLRQLTSTL